MRSFSQKKKKKLHAGKNFEEKFIAETNYSDELTILPDDPKRISPGYYNDEEINSPQLSQETEIENNKEYEN